MAFRKRTFRRRPSLRRRGRPKDLLHFALCNFTTELEPSPTVSSFSCPNPLIAFTPICLGGQPPAYTVPGGGALLGNYQLSGMAERGGTVGPFRFKHTVKFGNFVNQVDDDLAETFDSVVYNAIVKMEYDYDAYRNGQGILVAGTPNIVHTTTAFGASASVSTPLSDLGETDVLWRDITFGSHNAQDLSSAQALRTQDLSNFGPHSWGHTPQWCVIRVKRRLKENEGLFWVTNVVSGIPSFVQGTSEYFSSITEYVYGFAAARIR